MKFRDPTGIRVWILVCAYLNCAGWALSALHELNAVGYSVALALGFVAWLVWRNKTAGSFFPQIRPQKFFRRFRRPLPAIFLFVAAMAFIGGAIYPPNNYDALTYRLPRMLNWLAAAHWFWIPSANARMNFSGTAWEWTAMPFLAVLRSDRGLFLINAMGFLLMPGLFFSVFRQLGVARRVAWTWIWILPLAYGYATQAGSIGNDSTGMLFGLISVHYGLRARRSQDVKDVWLVALAAALMTGTKASNLPLLLPCLVAVWPALVCLRRRWLGSIAVMAVAALVSAAPTMALNQLHTGSWNGDPKNLFRVQIKSPAAALLGNGILLLEQSCLPPVLPAAHKVDGWLNEKMPAAWRKTLAEKFPRYFLNRLNELPQEETAGLGLGVTLLLLAGAGAGSGEFFRRQSFPKMLPVGVAAWISILFFMAKMGSEATGRLLLPYYPLAIVPILLLPVQERLLHFRVWKIFIVLAALSVLPAIILSPSRPLWPAQSLSERLARHYPQKEIFRRFATVYSTYARRNDLLAPLRAALPDDARNIGFLAGENGTDYSLWRPFGRRRVEYLQDNMQSPVRIPADVAWLVINRRIWPAVGHAPLDEWAAQQHATITMSVPILSVVAQGEETWCLLHIERP